MKICVASMENRTSEQFCSFAMDNHRKYCAANGYDYYEVNDFSRWPRKQFPHFYKFCTIAEALRLKADYVLWADNDAVFTSFTKRIEDFIVPDADLMAAKDCSGGRCLWDDGLNIGVMLVKVCQRTVKLFDFLNNQWVADLFSELQRRRLVDFYDQSSFTWCCGNVDEFKGIVTEIPAKSFNSYVAERAFVGNAWTPGDLVLHLAGMSNSERMHHLKSINII